MTGPDLCPKCKGLHFKTDPCIVRKVKQVVSDHALDAVIVAILSDKSPFTVDDQALVDQFNSAIEAGKEKIAKRPVGRPKTITDMKAYKAKWAREYRARKALSSQPQKGKSE